MFELNSKTQANKKFKMSELYKLVGASKEVKANATNISSVTLSNVLNADTANLPYNGDVKEIYIFDIVLTSKDIPNLFLSALDKAINFHTIFILRCENYELLFGAYKEYGDKTMKIGKYYSTDWAEKTTVKLPLNLSSLDDIYTFLIDELIPITARENERTSDLVARYDEVVRLQKEIAKLQHSVDTEKQSKRRFELNEKLKLLKKELGVRS